MKVCSRLPLSVQQHHSEREPLSIAKILEVIVLWLRGQYRWRKWRCCDLPLSAYMKELWVPLASSLTGTWEMNERETGVAGSTWGTVSFLLISKGYYSDWGKDKLRHLTRSLDERRVSRPGFTTEKVFSSSHTRLLWSRLAFIHLSSPTRFLSALFYLWCSLDSQVMPLNIMNCYNEELWLTMYALTSDRAGLLSILCLSE